MNGDRNGETSILDTLATGAVVVGIIFFLAMLIDSNSTTGPTPATVERNSPPALATATPVPASAISVAFLVLAPGTATLEVGQTQQFTVTAFDQFENRIPGVTHVFTARRDAGQIDRLGNFTAGTRSGNYEEAVTAEVTQGSVTTRAVASVIIMSDR